MWAYRTTRVGGGHRHAKGSHAAPRRPLTLTIAAVSLAAGVGIAGVVWFVGVVDDRPSTPAAPGTAGAVVTPALVEESVLAVRIGDDGTLLVEQRLALRQPLGRLDLSVPVRRGVTAALRPRVEDVVVVAGGRRRQVEATLTRGDRTSARMPPDVTEAVITYTATGVALRGEPALPERALVLATPLVLEQVLGRPSRIDIASVKALNVGCVGPRGEMVGCGTRTASGWTVETTGTTSRVDVVVQADLASP